MGDGCVFGGEDAGEEGGPGGEAFAGVDEDARGAGADEVGVCAWKGGGGSVWGCGGGGSAWGKGGGGVAWLQHGGSTLQRELHARCSGISLSAT